MKKMIMLIIICSLLIADCNLLPAQNAADDAEKEAAKFHELALSDVIYSDEEWKALYYQNVQIIELLKEISNLLKQQLEKEAAPSPLNF